MKLKAFLTSLINFAVSVGLLFLNHSLVHDIITGPEEARLGLIIVLPILIVTAILNLTTILTTVITSGISIKSENKAIKITSAFILILGIACLATFGYLAYTTIKIL